MPAGPHIEMRINRERIASAEDFADRTSTTPDDYSISVLVQTTTDGSYPTIPQAIYACNTGYYNCDSAEASTATFVADGKKAYVLNIGTAIPTVGTTMVAKTAGNKWIFRYDG
jgi:hypothetical protein